MLPDALFQCHSGQATFLDRKATNGFLHLIRNKQRTQCFHYCINGNRLSKALGNGTTATYAYDDASRLVGLGQSVQECLDAGLIDGRKLYADSSLVRADASNSDFW